MKFTIGGIFYMQVKQLYMILIQILVLFMIISLIFSQTPVAFVVIYAISAAILILHIHLTKHSWKVKSIFTIIYIAILVLQEVYISVGVFDQQALWITLFIKKLIAIIIIFIPYFVRYLHYIYTIEHQFAMNELSSVSFDMIRDVVKRKNNFKSNITKGKVALSKENINEIANDIPRHSYFKYLNKDILNDNYFKDCENSLTDEHVYIIISSTGSSASDLISLFTRKIYNHVSLSFDKELRTTISYNGGENVTLPGLNQEQLQSFNKKSDASIMVYKINVPKENKKIMIEKIREINETGSAYNLVGLVTKISIRPNIMFCSQFVYNILKIGNVHYFDVEQTKVKPTDFIENDYYRKLQFCYEIQFNELKA